MSRAHIPASAHDKRNSSQKYEIRETYQGAPAVFLSPGDLSRQKSTSHAGDHINHDNPNRDRAVPISIWNTRNARSKRHIPVSAYARNKDLSTAFIFMQATLPYRLYERITCIFPRIYLLFFSFSQINDHTNDSCCCNCKDHKWKNAGRISCMYRFNRTTVIFLTVLIFVRRI